jgi:CubicO group peptidase (beta-lactamase class C family)
MRPRDLLKLGQLVLAHGQWEGRRLVPAAWIERSMQPNLATDVSDFRYGSQWWSGSARWRGQPVTWHAAFGNGGQRLFVLPALDLAIVTTAGAYDQLTTAIAVNRLVQGVVDSVRE